MPSQTPAHLRLFIAILIPEDVKAAVEAAQTVLRRVSSEVAVRWPRREQFHLTLRFLGNLEATRAPKLTAAVRLACQPFAPLRMRAEQIGFFPDERFPRVIWVGIKDDQDQLPLLQRAVQSATQDFSAEKPEETFTGHITLGRIKRITRSEAEHLAKAAASLRGSLFGEWTTKQIDIMQSELLPEGAKHSSLATIPLCST